MSATLSPPRSAAEPPALCQLPSDCTIRTAAGLHEALLALPEGSAELVLDCAEVARADLTLLQLVLSAERFFAARGQRLRLHAVPDCVHALFVRGGVDAPTLLACAS